MTIIIVDIINNASDLLFQSISRFEIDNQNIRFECFLIYFLFLLLLTGELLISLITMLEIKQLIESNKFWTRYGTLIAAINF